LLKEYSDKDFPMSCVIATENGKNMQGLFAGHAWTLRKIKLKNNQWVAEVRNPWGSERWNGALSDNVNDGLFDMPWDRFYDIFDEVHVAHMIDDNKI